jgi:surface antigen
MPTPEGNTVVEMHSPNNRSALTTPQQISSEAAFPTRKSRRDVAKRPVAVARRDANGIMQPAANVAGSAPWARPAKPKKKGQHPLLALFTILIVPGFLAASSIPSFAVGTSDTTDASAVIQSADAVGLQSVAVASTQVEVAVQRDTFSATTHEELAAAKVAAAKAAARVARAGLYSTVGARAAGDDYPFTGSSGLSPLNYVARQCTDFVAWRLNRDAGTTSAPYKFVWSNLTPGGGSASQWAKAWANHGWQTSNTPVVGAVAWFNGNHVAYVKSITADGQVDLEEYNWNGSTSYHTRTIPASSVALFLYPPP